jgi:hypothetical protein
MIKEKKNKVIIKKDEQQVVLSGEELIAKTLKEYDENPFLQLWIDTSIKNNTLVISEVCRLLAPVLSMTNGSVMTKYYRDFNIELFRNYWFQKYADHFKSQARAKVHGQIDKQITNTRDLSKLVEVARYLEGDSSGRSSVQVNIQNNIKDDKDQYGFSVEGDTDRNNGGA